MTSPEEHNETSVFTILEQVDTPEGVEATIMLGGQIVTLNPINAEVMQIIGRMLQQRQNGEEPEGAE